MRFISLVLTLFVVSHAANTAAMSFEGNYETSIQETISSSAAYDTIAATDSITITLSNVIGNGYNFHLVQDAITGTGSDSVEVIVYLDNLDLNGNLLYRTTVDTLTATGQAIALPIRETALGPKYRLKLVGGAANGGQVILNRLYIVKRRAVQVFETIR